MSIWLQAQTGAEDTLGPNRLWMIALAGIILSVILFATTGSGSRAQEADPLLELQQLLERGRADEAAEGAARILAATPPASRADSIALFAATRVYIGARLQASRYEDPSLADRISSLTQLSETLFGVNSPFLVDASLYAAALARGTGALAASLEHFRSALARAASQSPAMPAQVAQAHQGLAEVLFQLQRYPEAQREFELELKARLALAPDGLLAGIALINLNEARQAAHDTLGMGAAYAQAQRIFARQEGEASARHADAHYREGAWRFASSQIPDAASALDRALEAFAQGARGRAELSPSACSQGPRSTWPRASTRPQSGRPRAPQAPLPGNRRIGGR